MKDFVKFLSQHYCYYSAFQVLISRYYQIKTREIIQKNTDTLSVFHFSSTKLIKEKSGVSYYVIRKISDSESAVINSKGEFVVPFDKYDYLDYIKKTDAVEYSKNNKWGMINFNGERSEREKESESLSRNFDNGVSDKIVEAIIEEIKNSKERNIFLMMLNQTEENWQKNQKMVLANTKLLETSPFATSILDGRYSESRFFTNEKNKRFFILRDKKTNKCALINAKGEQTTEFIYDDYLGFTDSEGDFISVMNDNKIGTVDCLGNVVIDSVYDDIISFSDGLSVVKQNKKYGYINSTGEIVIPLIFDDAGKFILGKAKVTLNGETFYINRKGERVEG